MGNAWISRLSGSPVFFGVVVGMLAVVAQLLFMPGNNAYGLCTICHSRDLLAYLFSRISDADPGGAVSYLAWPAFTTVGLAFGALCASVRNGEFRWRRPFRGGRMFILGILAAVSGLAVMSCPTRVFLRFSYSDPFALFALVGLVGGIFAASRLIKKGR